MVKEKRSQNGLANINQESLVEGDSSTFKKIADLIDYISLRKQTINELLRFLTLNTLSNYEATSAFIVEIGNENDIRYLGSFGINKEDFRIEPDKMRLSDNLPITQSLKSRKITLINTLPKWPEEYPMLQSVGFPSVEKTFIACPIQKYGTPSAAMGLFCRPAINPNSELDAFLTLIGNALALHLYYFDQHAEHRASHRIIRSNGVSVKGEPLSERQELILKLIAEGRTNLGISELLGYSESTIRQETIKIYTKLNCNGRHDAIQIYKARYLQNISE